MLPFLSIVLLSAISLVSAQLSGTVGPTTSSSSKRATICNVLNYGGSVGSSDIGPAILSAFNNCVVKNSGSTLYVPPGNYNMQTWVTLSHGTKWAFQLDGIIYRTSTTGGNMIAIQYATDFEFYSSTKKGAIQGYGYQCRNAGPRLLRIIRSTNFNIHDIILVDSPEFHLTLDTATSAEVFNVAIRGANIGGSDGIDVWGTNVWVHDVQVTNRDECVTVKSPADHMLIEQIYCNQSGGSAIGSLGADTAISNILYRYVYTVGGNQMFMLKSNGGSGYVQNVVFDHFIGLGSAYGLNVDQYWSSQTTAAGNGVQLSNITFSNWSGYISTGAQRPTIRVICADGAPCTGMTLSNIVLWAADNTAYYSCESAYGSGFCLKSGSGGSYSATKTTYSKPSNYATPTTMAGNLASGFATNSPIPIPTIPTTFYPGRPQISSI